MSTYILQINQKDKKIFDQIKSGEKTFETRAASVRYKDFIKEGDTLVFYCGHDKLSREVKKKYFWKTPTDMTKEVSIEKIMPGHKTIASMKKLWGSFPGYLEKIKEEGIVGFQIN